MKKIMEMLQNMKTKNEKKDNKGFSLVELIIVIAIMAILVGIVGTQVLPYINKSKQAKDVQVLNSYSTAAVSAYSMLAGELGYDLTKDKTLNLYASLPASGVTEDKYTDDNKLAKKIVELVGYDKIADLQKKMTSGDAKKTSEISIKFDFPNHTVTTTATDGNLDPITADL